MSPIEQKREVRLQLLEDEIGRKLAESASMGELAKAPSYGKPLNLGDGYDETPAELRMPFKMLKDAGYVPPEVLAMQEVAALRAQFETLALDSPERVALQRQISDKQQQLALRLERLRGSGSL